MQNPNFAALSTRHESVVLQLMQLMPFFIINTRSFCVLCLLFLKRNHWTHLVALVQTFLETSFPSAGRPGVALLMRKRSLLLCCVTFGMHVLWEAVEWTVYLQVGKQ